MRSLMSLLSFSAEALLRYGTYTIAGFSAGFFVVSFISEGSKRGLMILRTIYGLAAIACGLSILFKDPSDTNLLFAQGPLLFGLGTLLHDRIV